MSNNKLAGIIGFVLVVAFSFWFTAKAWVNEPIKYAIISHWITPMVLLVLLMACMGIAFIILTDRWWKLLISALVGLGFIAMFGFTWLNLGGFVLTIGFHAWAIHRIEKEKHDHLKLHVGSMVAHGSLLLAIPLMLCLSFAYYQSPLIQDRPHLIEFPPTLREVVGVTVDRFVEATEDARSSELYQSVKNDALNKVVAGFQDYTKPYEQYFPPFLAFWQFVILLGISFVFTYLAELISVILFMLLRKTKFISVQEIDVKAEVIQL